MWLKFILLKNKQSDVNLFGFIRNLPLLLPTTTYLLTYAYTYLPTYLLTYAYTYLPTYLPTYLCLHLPMLIPTYAYTYLPMLIRTYQCLCLSLPNYLPIYASVYYYLPMLIPTHLSMLLPTITYLPMLIPTYLCLCLLLPTYSYTGMKRCLFRYLHFQTYVCLFVFTSLSVCFIFMFSKECVIIVGTICVDKITISMCILRSL